MKNWTWALKDRYGGRSVATGDAISRAIRSEIPGGDLLLDATERLHVELTGPHKDRGPAELAILGTARRLMAEVRTAMERAVMARYGYADEQVPGDRKRAKSPAPPSGNIPADVVARLGTTPLDVLARQTGISANRLRRERERLGIEPPGPATPDKRAWPWTAKLDAMIRRGRPASEVIAAAGDGRSEEAVRRRRLRIGGRPARPRVGWTPAADRIVLEMRDVDAVTALAKMGIVASAVAVRGRKRRLLDRQGG